MRMNSRPMRFAVGGTLLLSFAATGLAQNYSLPTGQPVQRLAAEDYPRAQRLDELHEILAHQDHSIDLLNAARPDPKGNRKLAVEQLTKARDAVQRIIAELENRGTERAVDRDHARDERIKHEEKPATYYGGLMRVNEYIKNDTIVLTRHPADPNHHRGNALKALDEARVALHAEMEDYHHVHPDER
jgi:hypothetical protein